MAFSFHHHEFLCLSALRFAHPVQNTFTSQLVLKSSKLLDLALVDSGKTLRLAILVQAKENTPPDVLLTWSTLHSWR